MGSGTNLFGLFSCIACFWNRAEGVCSDSTCVDWQSWLLAVWAIGFSDWLCASYMTILIGGVLANQRGVWEGWNTVCALFFYALRSVISCFHVLEYWLVCLDNGVYFSPRLFFVLACSYCLCIKMFVRTMLKHFRRQNVMIKEETIL